MEIILVWFVCAVICYFLASEKNRNTTAWVVMGFLFGVFAVIALMLLPKISSDKCPHCKETVQAGATICKHCGGTIGIVNEG